MGNLPGRTGDLSPVDESMWPVDVPEDDDRAIVFIDAPNLAKACGEQFGHERVHPLLVARSVADKRKLTAVRYYATVPDPAVHPEAAAAVRRRHAVMSRTGVTVVERGLTYRWSWDLDEAGLPDPAGCPRHRRRVRARSRLRGREKGLDLALALDVVELALAGAMDVAVVVSADTDLCELPRAVRRLCRGRVRVEAAVFGRPSPRLCGYDRVYRLGRRAFLECRDSFDYSRDPDPAWVGALLVAMGVTAHSLGSSMPSSPVTARR